MLNPNVLEVDTIEIEKKVIEAAKVFINRNEAVFKDKRSRIYVDDAKTFFSTHGHKYDIIISEPSNPWISGVASLFTKEFYALTNRYLKKGGILVQWVQLYEIDMPHIASIIKALSKNFVDYALYVTTENEMLIISSNEPLGCLDDTIFQYPQFKRVFQRLNMTSMNDFIVRKIGEKKYFDKFFNSFPVIENSDFYPILERKAPKLRFLGEGAGHIMGFITGPIPITRLLMKDEPLVGEVNLTPYFQRPYLIRLSNMVKDLILKGKVDDNFNISADILSQTQRFSNFLENPEYMPGHLERIGIMFNIFSLIIPHLPEKEVALIIHRVENSRAYKKLTHLEIMWLKLFKAINKKDYLSMKQLSVGLLEKDKGLPPVAEEYLLASYMIGQIMEENKDELKGYMENSTKIKRLMDNNIIFRYLSEQCN